MRDWVEPQKIKTKIFEEKLFFTAGCLCRYKTLIFIQMTAVFGGDYTTVWISEGKGS